MPAPSPLAQCARVILQLLRAYLEVVEDGVTRARLSAVLPPNSLRRF